jgi:peptide/nickel transport system ATP-binding protein
MTEDGARQTEALPVILDVQDLRKYFPIERGILRRVRGHVRAVDGVSLAVREGKTLGLVGESGCGKTTLGRCIVRAIEPTEGEVVLHVDGQDIDVSGLTQRELRPVRQHMQMIFQDPYSSLDPRKTILDIVAEPLRIHNITRGRDLEERVRDLLDRVGLNVQYLKRYPHAFSGGQRQRIGVARALSLNPKLIVCDEPVSALDVSVQAQIINLLDDLQKELGLAYLFIAHDLSVVQHISDEVAVMYVGKIVEFAETDELFFNPKHPYTEALLSAVPTPDPDHKLEEIELKGEIANPADPPSGCYFHPRCQYAEDICREETPPWKAVGDGHNALCHFADTLQLRGVEEEKGLQGGKIRKKM